MRRGVGLGAAAVLVSLGSGCPIVTHFIAVAMPKPKVPARYDLQGQRVVLLCTANERIEAAYGQDLEDLVAQLSRQLRRQVKGIDIVPADQVDAWRQTHPGFDALSRREI